MLSINTNLSSLIAQNSLNASTFSLNQAIERMTTGFKINHASDNAANYSISNNMSTKLGSFEIAQDNVAAGMDLVTVASDNLSLISDHVTRIRNLCIQAQNGTYGEQSLKAIQSEVNARIAEVERLYNTAEYNGIKLLNKNTFSETTASESIPEGMLKAGASGFIDEDFERITPDVIVTDPTQLANAIANNTTIGIGNAETLAKLAELVNSGTFCSGKTITLTSDIDLSAYSTGQGWTPIGITDLNNFRGTFDGQGHKVKNLYINRPDSDYQGLFGYVAYRTNTEIKNLGVENCNITANNDVGGLIGRVDGGTFKNCYATGNVNGKEHVGGLTGILSVFSSVENSYASVDVVGQYATGGFSGTANAWCLNCYTTGDVSGRDMVGGFTGTCNSNEVSNCISYSQSVSGTMKVGSFVGYGGSTDIFTNCKTTKIDGLNKVGSSDEDFSGIEYITIPPPPSPTGDDSITLQVGIYGDDSSQIIFKTGFSSELINQLKTLDVTNSSSLDFLDDFLNKVSEKQTEFGAVQNRLDSAAESISVSIENLTKSRSTLRDADIAKESSEYIKAQILQQASATLLATANQSPAIALQLI